MAGYTRQSTYTDGDVINASDSNDEFDQLVNAFSNTTGHSHDGTSAEGPVIGLIGDPGVATPVNKLVVDDTNNRFGLFIDVSGTSTEQVRFQDGAILPVTDDDVDLGSSSSEFKNLYIDGTANIDSLVLGTSTAITSVDTDLTSVSASDDTLASAKAIKTYVDAQVTAQDLDIQGDTGGALSIDLDSETLTIAGTTNEITTSGSGNTITVGLPDSVTITTNLSVGGNATVTGNATINGNTTLGNAATDTVTVTADIASNLIPDADSTRTLGDSSNYWASAYIDAVTTTGNVAVGGNLTVTGNATIAGNLTFGDAATDTVSFTADVDSHVLPKTDDTYDLGASGSEWRDIYIDGTAYVDAINYNGTAITSTAAELNILDGVTSTATELNLVDGSTAGTVVNSKAVIYGAAGEVNATTLQVGGTAITATPAELNVLDGITSTTAELNILDGVTSTASELNLVDGSTAGTVVNSKAVIYGSAGEVNATTLQIGGTAITSTAAELNILDGVTATATEINLLDGVTATTAELNILDGVTATATEINLLDGVTATTSELNILDGVTATASELNTMDGITATTAELNYTDGVTSSIQTQIDDANSNALALSIALG